ncbi:porin family protein [Bradyrhizobium manausense]|uniref:outer membrane protein n=1 Tax=Bradyrhizobium TaxID=374 RepID=UPI001BA5E945|nr:MULTISPECIES: outer membrane protein [Bradyrhizobium]MBR0828145.1 porin family protein [Bradyrhizobium manausense]UVO33000.1 porin family protein [Bradyrhizobium arachidis]
MKKVLLASASLLAFSTFAPAMAADLAARPYTKAPAPLAAVYNWTGFYIGAMGGYASESGGDPKMKGGFVGGTIGYNWQTSNIVFGLEADGAWADVNASSTVPVVFGAVVAPVTTSARIDALGTVRGRVGVAFDQVLLYATGGYAWIDNKFSVSALGVTVSESHFHNGWTVGAGIEAFFAPQWSVKGEYLYRSLGSENYFGVPSGTLNLHSVQVGVNYHFGGPVVAKY